MGDSVLLAAPDGSSAEVRLFGATVTSFRDAAGREVLFLSREAVLDGSAPIRGGIPVVFPQFGPDGPLVSHGFARRSTWAVAEQPADGRSVTLALEASDETRAVWPHDFRLEYAVSLVDGGALETRLRVLNGGAAPFEAQALLHTYYRVASAADVRVEGLAGCTARDKLTGGEFEQGAEPVAVAAELDAIFRETPRRLAVSVGGGAAVDVEQFAVGADGQEARSDTVVWNPWVAKAQRMGDFGDDEYQEMVCVEPGKVHAPAVVGPGEAWELVQVLRPRL